VSLRQAPGAVLAVIGPNGAGKTSLFNCLTGVYRPQRGSVAFRPPGRREPVEVLGRSPHAVTRLGMARTFQHTRLFGGLNAFENVQVGVESRRRSGALRDLVPNRAARAEREAAAARVWELLDLVGLAHRAEAPAASLPYGERRRLEIARALGTGPSLLLLDEPAAGATAAERRELADLVRGVAAGGISVLLIEHDVPLVMSLASSVVVLNFGRVIATGTPEAVRADPAVVEAYLGVGAARGRADAPDPGAGGTGQAGGAGEAGEAGDAGLLTPPESF
jgi:branched-chain amino acid transport system ATP-binding protein